MRRRLRTESTGLEDKDLEAAGVEPELRPLLGITEVAHLLDVPTATLYRWHLLSTADAPVGPCALRVGRSLCYTLDNVRTCIEHFRINPS